MFPWKMNALAALAVALFVAAPPWPAVAQESAGVPASMGGKDSSPEAKKPVLPAAAEEAAPAETPPEPPKASRSEVMARVNGAIISQIQLDRAVTVEVARNQLERPGKAENPQQLQGKALDDLIRGELLYQEASKLKVNDLDQQVAASLARDRARFPDEAQFQQALQQADITLKELQDIARRNIVCDRFIQERFAVKAVVTEAEARQVYQENLEKLYRRPERVRLSQILIGVDEKAVAEERTKAKQAAEGILKRVKAGENFAEIAKAESSCPSAARGGDVGEITRGKAVLPIEKVAFTLNVGEVSGVVATQYGFHIVKVTEKHPAETVPFDSAKADIMADLKKRKVDQEVLGYLERLRQTAQIEKL